MYHTTKKKVHGLLHPEIVGDDNWDKVVNTFIIILIILNVLAVMLETVPSLQVRYHWFFHYFEIVSVIIFSIEYVLRVWSSNHDPKYKHSFHGRLRYMVTPGALIDLMAILPFYLYRILGFDLRILRMLRLLRFFRLFRLTAYMKAAKLVSNVFKSKFHELLLSLILIMFLVIIASCFVFFAEHLQKDTNFTSIPATIWWAVVSLTTVGYGDMIPETVWGKTFASLILLAGVALFALPAGIITSGFLDEMRKIRNPRIKNCPHCGKPIDLDENHDH
jgi:voltage-gated potassium channel